eukprot:s2949_g17.t3
MPGMDTVAPCLQPELYCRGEELVPNELSPLHAKVLRYLGEDLSLKLDVSIPREESQFFMETWADLAPLEMEPLGEPPLELKTIRLPQGTDRDDCRVHESVVVQEQQQDRVKGCSGRNWKPGKDASQAYLQMFRWFGHAPNSHCFNLWAIVSIFGSKFLTLPFPGVPPPEPSAVHHARHGLDRDAGNLWRKARHIFGNILQVMLKWISDAIHRSFLRRDVKLKADSLTVVEVERVMHDTLWERYVKRRKSILMQLGSAELVTSADLCIAKYWEDLCLQTFKDVTERTSATNVLSIFEDGFQDQPQLAHGAAFGSGIYFTECSSKADMYTEPAEHTEAAHGLRATVHDHGGLCCMLLCRVTLGRARKLDSEFHVDKNQLKEAGLLLHGLVMATGHYHSVLADRERLFSSYREFVTPADQVARSATPVPNLRQSYMPQPAPAAAHVPCYHAEKLRQQLQAKQQAIRVMEPFRKVNGEWVDYWSEYHQCWIPASILDVDPESGGIVLDVKPGTALRLHDQWRVRPRRMPTPDQVSAVHKMLTNVELEIQAERFFHEIGRNKTDVIQRSEEVTVLGEKVNNFVGLLGCQVHLKVKFQSQNCLTFEDFRSLFWDIAHLQQDMSVQALQKEVAETAISGTPTSKYDICETLGKGTYGEVVKAKDKRTRQVRAIKIINKDKVHGDMEFLKQEIQNLIQLDHPHVLKLLEFYNSQDQVFLVTDHCSRGELHKHICDARNIRKRIPEAWIAHVMQQVLSAVTHIHANGIIHLDIKSQNIMLMPALATKAQFLQGGNKEVCSNDVFREIPHVMVIDLGVATIFQPGNFKRGNPMGTPATMAPEVWRGEITPKADVFSCGCVLFELLSFHMPWDFKYRGSKQEARDFWDSKPRPRLERIQHSPPDATTMMLKMLEQDRPSRVTAAEALREAFVQRASDAIPVTQMEKGLRLVNRLVTTCERDAFYKLICLKIAQEWPPNEMPSFKGVFKEFDDEGTGMLQESVLVRKFVSCGYDEQQSKRAAAAMNLSQNKNAVDWTEFVAACIDLGSPTIEPCIQMIFQTADKDRDGLLSLQDVRSLLPEGHRNAKEAAQAIFLQITGRASETGARMDWHSFITHLHRQARSGMPEEAFAPEVTPATPTPSDILTNVTDALRATADEWISSLNSVGQNWFMKAEQRNREYSKGDEMVLQSGAWVDGDIETCVIFQAQEVSDVSIDSSW